MGLGRRLRLAVEDGKVKRIPVRIIQRNTEPVLIDAPIASGDMVVTEGTQSVSEGREVRIAGQEQRGRRATTAHDRECNPPATPALPHCSSAARSAFVLNTLIAVAGLAAFYGVEIRELPDVDRAVDLTVSTTFEGAAAETVDRELTDTIEGAVARVSGVKSISSTSSFGLSRVTIEFNDGVDL